MPQRHSLLPAILAMALVVLASNILVQFVVGDFLTWGAFTYPFAFLVTDLTNRLRGAHAARRVVLAGFVTGIGFSLAASFVEGPSGQPLTTLRIATGSGLAFLAGQLLDIAVFNRLRAAGWWKAPLVSSLAGSVTDTAIFFSVAFSATLSPLAPSEDVTWAAAPLPFLGLGPETALWHSLAAADLLVKLALAALALIPFRLALALLLSSRGSR